MALDTSIRHDISFLRITTTEPKNYIDSHCQSWFYQALSEAGLDKTEILVAARSRRHSLYNLKMLSLVGNKIL
ncbi:MAG: hypothetical protein DCE90_16225 [Pseudanabaena sp.]|nr:MAG: hypothetical protein DCE90_16225 [Pseudanabaena sp.]